MVLQRVRRFGAVTCALGVAIACGPSVSNEVAVAELRGRLTFGTEPMAATALEVKLRGGGGQRVVTTSADGTFRVGLPRPGEYAVVVRTLEHLSATHRIVEAVPGQNDLAIDLPPTSVDVRIDNEEGTLDEPVQVEITGPASPASMNRAGIVLPSEAKGFTLRGMGFGDYVITANTPSGLTSRGEGRAVLSGSSRSASIRLLLTRRRLSVIVQDDRGRPIEHAALRATSRELEGVQGRFEATRLAAGERIQVDAIGFVATCRVVAAGDGEQRITLVREGIDGAVIRLIPAVPTPRGFLEGLASAQCPVSIRGFRLEWVSGSGDVEGLRFKILGLPRGRYEYKADPTSPPVTLDVPGTEVTYHIPDYCVRCG
jgi:hypothetical protein